MPVSSAVSYSSTISPTICSRDVLHRHEAGYAAVFVDDDGNVNAAALHTFQQLVEADRFGDVKRLSDDVFEGKGRIGTLGRHVPQEFLRVEDADDVVGRGADHWHSGVPACDHQQAGFLERGIGGDAFHFGARRHDGRDVFLLGGDHALDHPPRLRSQDSLALPQVDYAFDLAQERFGGVAGWLLQTPKPVHECVDSPYRRDGQPHSAQHDFEHRPAPGEKSLPSDSGQAPGKHEEPEDKNCRQQNRLGENGEPIANAVQMTEIGRKAVAGEGRQSRDREQSQNPPGNQRVDGPPEYDSESLRVPQLPARLVETASREAPQGLTSERSDQGDGDQNADGRSLHPHRHETHPLVAPAPRTDRPRLTAAGQAIPSSARMACSRSRIRRRSRGV